MQEMHILSSHIEGRCVLFKVKFPKPFISQEFAEKTPHSL